MEIFYFMLGEDGKSHCINGSFTALDLSQEEMHYKMCDLADIVLRADSKAHATRVLEKATWRYDLREKYVKYLTEDRNKRTEEAESNDGFSTSRLRQFYFLIQGGGELMNLEDLVSVMGLKDYDRHRSLCNGADIIVRAKCLSDAEAIIKDTGFYATLLEGDLYRWQKERVRNASDSSLENNTLTTNYFS